MINQNDARNFVLALNSIAGYVPPLQFQALTNSPVADALQHIANGHLELVPKAAAGPNSGETGPPVKPHLVHAAETGETG